MMSPSMDQPNTSYEMIQATSQGRHSADPSCAWADSSPNWTVATDTLQAGLDVHIYTFAICFAAILCYTLYIIIVTMKRGPKRNKLGVSLHIMIAIASLTRATSLLVDPYGSRQLIPCPFNVIIWSFGWPSIVSSYSIFLLVVLETTRMSMASPKFQRLSILLIIIVICLSYVLIVDLLVSYVMSAIVSVLLCELLFIILGMLLSSGFMYVWWKVRRNLSVSCPQTKAKRRKSSASSAILNCDSEKKRLKRLIFIFACSAGTCALLTLTHIIPIVAMFDRTVATYFRSPWTWWFYQTGQRCLEVTICIIILLAMVKSTREKTLSSKKKIAPNPGQTSPTGNEKPNLTNFNTSDVDKCRLYSINGAEMNEHPC